MQKEIFQRNGLHPMCLSLSASLRFKNSAPPKPTAGTKRLATTPPPLRSRPMKRLALSISIAAAALGLGACEPQAEPPEHYKHKGGHHDAAETGHDAAPAHGEKAKAPAAEHKS